MSQLIKDALNHKESTQVPVDLGGLNATTLMLGPYQQLCQHYAVDPGSIYVVDIWSQTVTNIGDGLKSKLSNVNAKYFCRWPKEFCKITAYNGTEAYYPKKFQFETLEDGSQVYRDAHGKVIFERAADSPYFNLKDHPVAEAETIADLDKDKYAIPIKNLDRGSMFDMTLVELAKQAKTLSQEKDIFLTGSFGAHIFSGAKQLRGWTTFLEEMIGNPAFAEALVDRITQGHMEAFDEYWDALHPYLDAIQMNDDLGMQDAGWISLATFRKFIKPYYQKLFGFMKQKSGGVPLILHSDGAVYDYIPDLIEVGIDVLNPVQYTAKNMDLDRLKKDFGDDLSFWGAGIDTQGVLMFGTTQEVADEVKRNIDIMAPGGGFVFASIQNLLEGTPIENIATAFETALAYK